MPDMLCLMGLGIIVVLALVAWLSSESGGHRTGSSHLVGRPRGSRLAAYDCEGTTVESTRYGSDWEAGWESDSCSYYDALSREDQLLPSGYTRDDYKRCGATDEDIEFWGLDQPGAPPPEDAGWVVWGMVDEMDW